MGEFPNQNNGNNIETKIRGRIVTIPNEVNGQKYISVNIKDASGRPAILSGVRLEDSIFGFIVPIGKGKLVDVTFPSTADYIKLNSASAKAIISTDTPNTENQAVPANLLGKIDQNSLKKGDNNVCLTMRAKAADVEMIKRDLSKKEDLSFIQHPNSKNSPGMVIDKSSDGSITQFDTNGNIVKIGKNGLVQDVSMVNSESANRGKRSLLLGGLAGIKTDSLTEMVPHGNIFTPTPTIIPDITSIVGLFGIIRMIMGVQKIAKEGLQELHRLKKQFKEEEKLEKIKENLKIMAFLLEQEEENRYNEAQKTNPTVNRDSFKTQELREIKKQLNMADTEKVRAEDVGQFGYNPKSDNSNISRAQKLQILKKLNTVLENNEDVDPATLKTIDSFIQAEKKEREAYSKAKSDRSKAFDRIVNNSSKNLKNTAAAYNTEGTKQEAELDKVSFLQEVTPNKAVIDKNAFTPKKPFIGD